MNSEKFGRTLDRNWFFSKVDLMKSTRWYMPPKYFPQFDFQTMLLLKVLFFLSLKKKKKCICFLLYLIKYLSSEIKTWEKEEAQLRLKHFGNLQNWAWWGSRSRADGWRIIWHTLLYHSNVQYGLVNKTKQRKLFKRIKRAKEIKELSQRWKC